MSEQHKKYKDMHLVIAKCPVCSQLHKVKMTARPIITPRIFFPDHIFLRYGNDQGYDYSRTSRTGRRSAQK